MRNINQTSQSSIDKKALAALHASDQSKLSDYQNETYYELDKAIIDNDANAVSKATQKLENLNLHDRYRSEQVQSLLKQAGQNTLAQKVADANK